MLVAVEQLRRAVPGGIGRYAVGPARGPAPSSTPGTRRADVDPAGQPAAAGRRSGPAGRLRLAARDLAAARAAAHPGLGPRAWSGPRPGFDVVHAVSLAVPPSRPARGRSPAGRDRPRPGLAALPRGHHAAGPPLARGGAAAGPCARPTLLVVPSEAVAARTAPRPGARRRPVSVVAPRGRTTCPRPTTPGAGAAARRPGSTGPLPADGGHPRAPQEPATGCSPPTPQPGPRCPSPGPWWWWGPRAGATAAVRGRPRRPGRWSRWARSADGVLAALYAAGPALRLRAPDRGLRAAPRSRR